MLEVAMMFVVALILDVGAQKYVLSMHQLNEQQAFNQMRGSWVNTRSILLFFCCQLVTFFNFTIEPMTHLNGDEDHLNREDGCPTNQQEKYNLLPSSLDE